MSVPEAQAQTREPVVRLRGVSKEVPGALAMDDVDLEILPGEVHVLAGENGAGESTLMKLLSQVERPSEGEIELSGQTMEFHGPRYAQDSGVAMLYQEFALAPHLSVSENLFMGREPGRLISSLTVAEQQRVEIAKALAIEAKVLILDEPTATLTEQEIGELFEVIRDLTSRGIAVLYISRPSSTPAAKLREISTHPDALAEPCHECFVEHDAGRSTASSG